MNGKHRARWLADIISELQRYHNRARWLADIISELQRYHKKARGQVEDRQVSQALEQLQVARENAMRKGMKMTDPATGFTLQLPGPPIEKETAESLVRTIELLRSDSEFALASDLMAWGIKKNYLRIRLEK